MLFRLYKQTYSTDNILSITDISILNDGRGRNEVDVNGKKQVCYPVILSFDILFFDKKKIEVIKQVPKYYHIVDGFFKYEDEKHVFVQTLEIIESAEYNSLVSAKNKLQTMWGQNESKIETIL